jgi:hypothetical protein
MASTLSADMGSGVVLDVGLEETKLKFDRVVNTIFDAALGEVRPSQHVLM